MASQPCGGTIPKQAHTVCVLTAMVMSASEDYHQASASGPSLK